MIALHLLAGLVLYWLICLLLGLRYLLLFVVNGIQAIQDALRVACDWTHERLVESERAIWGER